MKISKELHRIIKEAFEFNKNVQLLIVTEDGNCFLPEARNHAVNHAYKNGIKYFEVKRDDIIESSIVNQEEDSNTKIEKVHKDLSFDESIANQEVESNTKGEAVHENLSFNDMTVKELKIFAEEKGIEIKSSKKADIINEIKEKLTDNE